MSLRLHARCGSALILALPLLVSPAHARSKRGEVPPNITGVKASESLYGYRAVVPDDDAEIATLTGEVVSDAGEEELSFEETDAWLHGTAGLAAEPSEKSLLTLTLYDEGSASVATFSATYLGGGSVTFTNDSTLTSCTSKLDCSGDLRLVDVEVLGAALVASSEGYELSLDLNGADTWSVAYGQLKVVDAKGGSAEAELDWLALGSVWTAAPGLEHTGVTDLKLKARDAAGNKLDTVKAELAAPWLNAGEGVSPLVADEDPQSQLALTVSDDGTPWVTVVSEGWYPESYPTHAAVELADGSATVAANSYQGTAQLTDLLFKGDKNATSTLRDGGGSLTVTVGKVVLPDIRESHADTALCSSGTCVVLVETADGYALSVTAYGTSPASLPTSADVAVVLYTKAGEKFASHSETVAYDDEVAAVFTAESELEGDPIGHDGSGKVKLLGPANKKGKQETLSKGKFHGVLTRNGDGELALGGTAASEESTLDTPFALLLGPSVACGGDGCDGDWAPPVLLHRDRIGAYVVGVRRVSASVKLKGNY